MLSRVHALERSGPPPTEDFHENFRKQLVLCSEWYLNGAAAATDDLSHVCFDRVDFDASRSRVAQRRHDQSQHTPKYRVKAKRRKPTTFEFHFTRCTRSFGRGDVARSCCCMLCRSLLFCTNGRQAVDVLRLGAHVHGPQTDCEHDATTTRLSRVVSCV